MTTLDQHIQSLQQKMQLLVKKYQQLEKENTKLKEELIRLKETQSEKKQEVEVLEMQNAMLKASQQHLDVKEKKELEKKLSNYIKEIDRCIALLTE